MPNVPATPQFIQNEETSPLCPASESMLQKVGGSQNYCMDALQQFAIGEVVGSMLTLTQFQAIMGTGWILCDGESVVGSQYQILTSNNNVPDARGQFFRGQQGARTDGNGNPDGNLPLATYTPDNFASHAHDNTTVLFGFGGFFLATLDPRGVTASGTDFDHVNDAFSSLSVSLQLYGTGLGLETQPYNGTINWFIRIN